MYDKYFQSISKDFEQVLGQMTCLNIHSTIIKKEQRPDTGCALVYCVEFKHLHKNIKGAVYFGFNDIECANSLAMSIANKAGVPWVEANSDDYLCEFMNTTMGIALTKWDKIGFSATFEPSRIIENSSLNFHNCGTEASIIVIKLDVSYLFFEVVFMDGSYESLFGKKILVVDDSLMIRQLLVKKLTKIGFCVEMACDGIDAIETFKMFEPDLVIMDQIMPLLSGLDAIVEIERFAPDAKFIMLSSTSRQDELNTASTLNVQSYLIKPLNLTELYKEIAKVFMKESQ